MWAPRHATPLYHARDSDVAQPPRETACVLMDAALADGTARLLNVDGCVLNKPGVPKALGVVEICLHVKVGLTPEPNRREEAPGEAVGEADSDPPFEAGNDRTGVLPAIAENEPAADDVAESGETRV